MAYRQRLEYCGCYYVVPNHYGRYVKQYLPQVDLRVHTTILSTTSRTTLTQTFVNPAKDTLKDVQYTFPLFDGVSVVDFQAVIGERTIYGVVKERKIAKKEYDEAIQSGKTAALLEQSLDASDTFTTSIGNVPPESEAVVYITYLGELEHDSQADGVRLTLPSVIAPRYGTGPALTKSALPEKLVHAVEHGKIDITVDVEMSKDSRITTIQSPSHPVTVTLGRASVNAEDVFEANLASAAYTGKHGDVFFEKDFVVIVKATGQDVPYALLETHQTILNQRAIMASLVPKFNLPNGFPEIVFVVDRSGSMYDKIDTLRSALRVFLKSLPVGVKFNVCSFGSSHSFMWEKSRTYDADSLQEAMQYVDTIYANFGGTEMYGPLDATVKNRFKDMDLEVLMLTDGEVWNQHQLFELVHTASAEGRVRFFTLGIGDQASHSLIHGIARAGDGFAQSVGTNEQLDRKVVRMLKGALTPHIKGYTLEVEYDEADDDEYEIIEKSNDIPTVTLPVRPKMDGDKMDDESKKKKPISLFNRDYKEAEMSASVQANLPELSPPKIIQAPYKIPSLYSFNRTSVYLLLSPETNPRTPKSVTLRGTSEHGPLQLTVPIENIGHGTTIHQLAARRTILELEEGRGWVHNAKDKDAKLVVEQHESKKEDFVKREAVRLGLKFQVGGKWCSFVAVEDNKDEKGPLVTLDYEKKRKLLRDLRASKAGSIRTCQPRALPVVSTSSAAYPVSQKRRRDRTDPLARENLRELAAIVRTPAHQSQESVSYSSFGNTAVSASTGGSSAGLFSASTGSGGTAMDISARGAPGGLFDRAGGTRGARMHHSAGNDVPGVLKKRRKAPRAPTEGYIFMDSAQSSELDAQGELALSAQSEATVDEEEIEAELDCDAKVDGNKAHALIALQLYDGSWKFTEQSFRIMGIKATDVESLDWASILGTTSLINKQDEQTRKVVATLLVALYLDVKCPEEKETWDLVHDKAMGWVDAAVVQLGGDVSKRDLQPLRALLA